MSAAEIHHELHADNSQNVLSVGTMRQLHRMFEDW